MHEYKLNLGGYDADTKTGSPTPSIYYDSQPTVNQYHTIFLIIGTIFGFTLTLMFLTPITALRSLQVQQRQQNLSNARNVSVASLGTPLAVSRPEPEISWTKLEFAREQPAVGVELVQRRSFGISDDEIYENLANRFSNYLGFKEERMKS